MNNMMAGKKSLAMTNSYSEQWRYKGSEKLRQPPLEEGANLSEQIEQ